MQFSAQQIAALVGGVIYGEATRMVSDVAPIESAKTGCLSFLCEEKYLPYLASTEASVVLLTSSLLSGEPQSTATVIAVDNARGAMAQLLRYVSQTMRPAKSGIEQPAYIAEDVHLPNDIYVGAYTYIGSGARIGARAQIYPQVYIGENVTIGEDTILYPGVKIYSHCHIGAHCILHAGVVVGADGFGFEPDAQGVNQKIPQIGNVVIEDDVEIGANTTIDRAMMGSTIIRRNAKLDNLVQVGHNVEVGESCFLCAQVGIAGSAKIGKHCILAGQVGVAGHLEVADGCVFGAKSGIASSIRQPGTYQGAPAIDAMNWRRSTVGFKQLPDILSRLRALENKKD